MNWHGFRCVSCEPRLGRAGGSQDPQPAWEGFGGGSFRGELTMENALLIGLSRQTMLERQLDVVSNNIANVNTTGYKADNTLFEEYLSSGAHEDNFVGSDRLPDGIDLASTARRGRQSPPTRRCDSRNRSRRHRRMRTASRRTLARRSAHRRSRDQSADGLSAGRAGARRAHACRRAAPNAAINRSTSASSL